MSQISVLLGDCAVALSRFPFLVVDLCFLEDRRLRLLLRLLFQGHRGRLQVVVVSLAVVEVVVEVIQMTAMIKMMRSRMIRMRKKHMPRCLRISHLLQCR